MGGGNCVCVRQMLWPREGASARMRSSHAWTTAHPVPPSPVPENRCIARSPDGDRTVLVSVPLPGTDPQRYMTETDASRHLLGPWASLAIELAPPGDSPWQARPYLPAPPLPTALAVHRGPLPEHAVRVLGAAIAETLVVAHGQILTHAGVSLAAVLLATDGPASPASARCAPPRRTGPRARGCPGSAQQPPARAGGRRQTATARRRARPSPTRPPGTPRPSGTNPRHPYAPSSGGAFPGPRGAAPTCRTSR